MPRVSVLLVMFLEGTRRKRESLLNGCSRFGFNRNPWANAYCFFFDAASQYVNGMGLCACAF